MSLVTPLSFWSVRKPEGPENAICTVPSLKTTYTMSLFVPLGSTIRFTNASVAPGTLTGVEFALSAATLTALKSAGVWYETCTPSEGPPACHKQPLSEVGTVEVIAAPNAVPIASAEGAAHPRARNAAALPLPDAAVTAAEELDPVATEVWLAAVLAVLTEVFALVDPPLLHAASTTATSPPSAAVATLRRTD